MVEIFWYKSKLQEKINKYLIFVFKKSRDFRLIDPFAREVSFLVSTYKINFTRLDIIFSQVRSGKEYNTVHKR